MTEIWAQAALWLGLALIATLSACDRLRALCSNRRARLKIAMTKSQQD